MKTLKQILEIFDSHYPYQIKHNLKANNGGMNFDKSDEQYHTLANFSTENNNYKVGIKNLAKNHANIVFGEKNINEKGFHKKNNELNKSHKVFGTVKKIMNDHLDKFPNITQVGFSASNSRSGKSKKKLYRSFARNLDPNYSEVNDDENGTFFTSHIRK